MEIFIRWFVVVFARFRSEFRVLVRRYFRIFPILLKPRSVDRELVLNGGSSARIGAIAFFGVTTSIASACYTALARYAIDDIELKPRFWQAPFELEIFGINLKNACVEFLNALILAGLAFAVIRLFRRRISYRECMSAFLYAYAFAILSRTAWLLFSNAFLTTSEQSGPAFWQWLSGSADGYNVSINASSQTFSENSLLLGLPFWLSGLINNGVAYFVPFTYSVFLQGGFGFTYYSAWNETLLILILIDWKVLLAAYILRLGPILATTMVVTCSIVGFYVDAVISRYTAKHTLLTYVSTRMHPTVKLTQTFKYSTTYFDNFPIKTGDLALIDFWQCKWSRHPQNYNFVNGRGYSVEDALHFEFTYTECNQAKPGFASFLVPEYEIVRVVANANQAVDITSSGEIKVDGSPIADRVFEADAEFWYRVPKAAADQRPDLKTRSTPDPGWVEHMVAGKQFLYNYRRARLPHEPQNAGYLWECNACGDDKITDDNYVVPEGYFLAMFDFMARPRVMLVRSQDLIGYPFVMAKKRW